MKKKSNSCFSGQNKTKNPKKTKKYSDSEIINISKNCDVIYKEHPEPFKTKHVGGRELIKCNTIEPVSVTTNSKRVKELTKSKTAEPIMQRTPQESDFPLRLLIRNHDSSIFIDSCISDKNYDNFSQCHVNYYLYKTMDDLYKRYFYHQPHYVLAAFDSKKYSVIFCISFNNNYNDNNDNNDNNDKNDNEMIGCIISGTDIIYFTIKSNILQKNISPSSLIKFLSVKFDGYHNFVFLKNSVREELVKFCDEFAFATSEIKVGVLFAKHKQTTGKQFRSNKDNKNIDCKDYYEFLKIMGLSEIVNGIDIFECNKPEDNWKNTHNQHDSQSFRVNWYIGSSMDDQNIRQHIGNVMLIIIFRDAPNKPDEYQSFDTNYVADMGIVNQIFIVVEKIVINNLDRYRVGVFYRNMTTFEPSIPENFLFTKENIRDVILTKLYNGMINIKTKSDVSKLYTVPRQTAFNELVSKNLIVD